MSTERAGLGRSFHMRRVSDFIRSPAFEGTAQRKSELDAIDRAERDVSVGEYVGIAVEYFDGRDAITTAFGIKGQALTQLLDIEIDRQRAVRVRKDLGMTDGI